MTISVRFIRHRRYRPEKEFDDHFDIDKVFEGHIGNFRESFLKEYIALPVYLYDHGGITISTSPFSCPWDSGFFGIIAVPLDKVRREYRWKNITAKRRKRIEDTCKTKSVPLTTTIPGKFSGIASCRKVTMTMNWTVVGDSMVRNV